MAEKAVAGTIRYQNLPPLVSFVYTVSHGATPSNIVVRTLPGKLIPPGIGQMMVSDGFRAFVLHDVRIDYFVADRQGGSGTEWEIRFSDERWKWQYSVVHGWYNQLDPNGKLIPSTVRSPRELAILCLRAIGVPKYTVDMPPGITQQDAQGQPEFLVSGINFPQIGLNPPCDWYGENAAVALSQLCDQCGRRLVFDPFTRTAHIVRHGVGANLPPGSLVMQQLSITAPDNPDAVTVLGSPTRYQPMLKLQAVAPDYDGQLKPIKFLSYAPLADESNQITRVVVTSVAEDALGDQPILRYNITVPNANGGAPKTARVEYEVVSGNTVAVVAAVLKTLTEAALAAEGLGGDFVVTVAAENITIEYSGGGPFDVMISTDSHLTQVLVAPYGAGAVSWDYCAPPLFMGVRATRRLTLAQATALAQRYVFKMYRITGTDVETDKVPVNVPGYGNVFKRQNIILLDGMVEQIVPEGGDDEFATDNGIDENDESLTVNLYEGYSKDKAGEVYGSVAVDIFNGFTYVGDAADAAADGMNTSPSSRVPVGFSVDATYGCILFADYIYRTGEAGTNEEPTLTLKTAVNIRHPETGQLLGYTDTRRIRNGPTIMVVKRPDVQLNTYGVYRYQAAAGNQPGKWKLTEAKLLEQDAVSRARFYLNATMLQFQLKPGAIQKYNGIVPVPMDGRITQVTYSIRGGVGCDTTVSLNGEHDVWVPPYPARRRIENLAAVDRVVPAGSRNDVGPGGPQFNAARNGGS